MTSPLRPMNPLRKPMVHRLSYKPHAIANDDEVTLSSIFAVTEY